MTTLIAVYNSDGCIGRCDAKCHNAKGAKCTCVCGGKNHGIGAASARASGWEIPQEDIEVWIQAGDPEGNGHRVIRQLGLFALE